MFFPNREQFEAGKRRHLERKVEAMYGDPLDELFFNNAAEAGVPLDYWRCDVHPTELILVGLPCIKCATKKIVAATHSDHARVMSPAELVDFCQVAEDCWPEPHASPPTAPSFFSAHLREIAIILAIFAVCMGWGFGHEMRWW